MTYPCHPYQLTVKRQQVHIFSISKEENFPEMDTTAEVAAQAVTLLQQGWSQRQVARTLQISQSAVSRIYRRHQETGGFHRRRGSGRSRSTSERDDRFIVSTSLRNRSTL
ncbi:unnamed protein product [Pieris brassicae]|uniref:Transposase IS30-like HTH domain-containing protein n=1 Tax=Pieris brassicae TaxID=7116 RepID=A0A9P0SXM8_PIEBR|nr:unnamed protein product [Pieris brassicae]